MAGRRALAAILLLAVAAGGGWYAYRKEAPPAKKAGGGAPVPVVLAKAEAVDLPLRLDLTGRTEAYESVTLKARIEGQVAAVPFTDGQPVQRGEVLVRLDTADLAARLRQAEANLARSQTQSAKAQNDVERYAALLARGFVSEEKVADMRTARAATEAVANADKAAVEFARLQLEHATVRAPFAGVIGAKLVFPGSAVKANETALAVLNRVQPLYAVFALPERQLPRLRLAMRGGAALSATVGMPGTKEAPQRGEVRFLDNAVDPATGTLQVKAVLANADGALKPGQFVQVGLVLETLAQAVTVPAQAVQQGPDGPFLFVAGSDDAVALRKVRVAAVQDGRAAIAEGLAAGEMVVSEGHLRLTPGTKIRRPGKGDGEARPAK